MQDLTIPPERRLCLRCQPCYLQGRPQEPFEKQWLHLSGDVRWMMLLFMRKIFFITVNWVCFTLRLLATDYPPLAHTGHPIRACPITLYAAISQDHYGFMWFGTYDGLSRYDGYEFKVFRNRLNDSTSLPHNYIYYQRRQPP